MTEVKIPFRTNVEWKVSRAANANISAEGRGAATDARLDGTGGVVFPTVEELQPGQTLTLTVEVDAAQIGDARFRVEVAAAHIKNTLKEEQSTRVTGK